MILLQILWLKLRMPSTLRHIAAAGVGLAYVGVVLMVFAIPVPFPAIVLVGPGMLLFGWAHWQLSRREKGR